MSADADREEEADAVEAAAAAAQAGAAVGAFWEGAEVDAAEARGLLVDLVSTPSPSGEEAAAAERLVAFFEGHGREAWLDAVGNVRAPGADDVLLTSHVDTVPGDIPVRVEAGVLWGRGSVDATGPLAAMAVAAVETGVSFVGVVGEEADSRGARHLVEDRDAPAAVVNGEPSGWDGLTLGYRGMVAGEYAVATEQAHDARPEPNALERAMAWWGRTTAGLAALTAEDAGDADADADAPVFEQVTAKPLAFAGGPREDGLAVEASMDVQFRVPPALSTDAVRAVAEEALDAGELAWRDAIPPAMQSPRTPLARAFRVAIRDAGGDPRLLRKTGTSDVNIYADAWDCPMATYGPGDSSLDHTPNEHLALSEYERAIAVLAAVSKRVRDEH